MSARQAEAYAGAQSAISWRDQVLALHDRGLTPGQIRYVMHLEDGGAGYEGWNGRIDDILRWAGPGEVAASSQRRSVSGIPSCDEMPLTRGGCSGPCKETLNRSGNLRFRLNDDESRNQSGDGTSET